MKLQSLISLCFFCFIFLFIFFIRPANKWNYIFVKDIKIQQKLAVLFAIIVTILIAVLPMFLSTLSPYWNGSVKTFADKQQYDRMGDALLQGHLYIDNGNIDPILEGMENPYDTDARKRLGVKFHWDEAYYNHHYYMYFGVVPTIILFIPYKLLTGNVLMSYQATQIFASLTIIGLFYLFYLLCNSIFLQFPFSLYLLFSSAFSILSVSYSIASPTLYCTAIISGVCMMIWSIVCFLKGAWLEKDKTKSNLYLFIGALSGALAFGCRPPVALANITVIAVICNIVQDDLSDWKDKIEKIVLIFAPYLVVGVLLMLYNYARFDNVFEFGQSYQLTLEDQHIYRSILERFDFKQTLIVTFLNFYSIPSLSSGFPFVEHSGVFFNFPVLLFSVRIFSRDIANILQEKKLYYFSLLALFSTLLITVITIYWSPFLLERYHLDFYYLLCIVSFLAVATWLELIIGKKRKILISCLVVLLFAVYVIAFLFFCLPFDGSYTMSYPDTLHEIYKGLRFGM